MKYTVEELAQKVQGKLVGNGQVVIEETRSLEQAAPQAISFAIGEYCGFVGQSKAGAVIVEAPIEGVSIPQIVVDNAKVAFSQLLGLYHPPVVVPRTIHETAIIGKNVTLGENISVGPYCIINDNAVIGDNVVLHPYVYIGHNAKIGEDTVIYPGAVVHENCVLGKRVVLRAKAVIGGEGFGFATENGVHTHIPQVGNVILEDDVEVGSCSCIDNATMGSTMVRRGTKIDNLVHLGHNVEIGEDCFLIAQVGIAGSTKCGNHVIFAGQTGSSGHLTIGDNVTFAGKTGIIGNVPSNSTYAGFPMRPHKEWLKISAYESRLPDMAKTLKRLEKEIASLKQQLDEK
ncbi:UDP-3-O-(3-hydroxymyristoyl)glucosamine N-acyltransferase [uncultured Veillonella sp.]|uniref:UDP-3-O-(3-hydroxymyristoyl)glucosamine N-acyltransferase n=1 Tax=uncultured Veillonella sp. TaxID=159268 RepID=UPI0025CF0044|nr:UDP-3-O-(3-hydroxymyristoyl)glucosamine N-acyltransferase [uncultured Veillonella sp.]MDY3974475.1 UDP-3-O-(3-hydroxymyristoyl)glucosamine N-acyltransferase [Veillonella caviae]